MNAATTTTTTKTKPLTNPLGGWFARA